MKSIMKIKAFLLIGLMTLFFSCTDYFSPAIPTLLPEEEAYNDFLSSRAAVNGLYAGLQELMTGYIVLGELRGDMLQPTPAANQDLNDIYQLKMNAVNRYAPYRKAYGLIHSCNDVVRHLALLRETGTTYDEELDNMYAEAILVRTWIYFYLFRNYEEIPYITSPYDSEAVELDIVAWLKSSSGQTVSLSVLEDDALSAISLLVPEKVSETEFFNRASAHALLAEMYLWENRYDDAVNILLEAIASGNGNRFILDRDLENAKWANIFKGDETANDEIITRIVFDKGEKQENELLPLFAAHAVGGNQLNVTEMIRTRFEGTHRFDGTFKSGLYVGKYTRSSDDPYTSDMPALLYRAADLHLMLAEAYNRLGETQTALNLLNNGSDSLFTAGSKGIRGRVAMKSLKLTKTDPGEIMLEMEDLIMLERSMELAFEGKRWYDILRIGIRRNSTDYIANKVMERFENPDSLGIRAYFADRANWFLPVE